MNDLRSTITTQGPQVLEVTHSRVDDDEAIHLSSHRVEMLDPADRGNVIAYAYGVSIDGDGEDDGAGFEYDGRWDCWIHQADIHDADLLWAVEAAANQCAGEVRIIDAYTFSYLAKVKVSEGYRGLGLGQWAAAQYLKAVADDVASSRDDDVVFAVVAGWPADGAQHHAPTELAAVDRIVSGLPVEQVGDPADRFHVGAPSPTEIEAAIAAATSRITGPTAA